MATLGYHVEYLRKVLMNQWNVELSVVSELHETTVEFNVERHNGERSYPRNKRVIHTNQEVIHKIMSH